MVDRETVKNVIEPEEGLRSQLLSDPKAQTTEYRVRNSSFIFKSVHPADAETAKGNGWEVHRAGKRQTRIKRQKGFDQLLEDRVWCLLYKVGYESISGAKFVLKFERNDGSIGRKQIDAFACDDETAFVIECKSRNERGKRSLQKDIQETISLQEYIRKSIFGLYPHKPKPRIIWVYATTNIIWTEQDVARAHDGRISILTENELQYYETFLKHMGPAGKYQLLGEFLKGQKVPGLGEVRLPAVRGKLGAEVFYSFVATPRRLLKIAFVNHQALNHPDGRPAYQRMISSRRIKEIGEFITKGGFFPTNLLLNFTESPRFDFISNKENTDPNIKFGWITLPTKYRAAWVIDGQHRLYGYSHLDDEFLDQSLFVVAFDKMNTRKEADLFITINHKQKSVPKSLLVSLLADIRLGDSDPKIALAALASAVIRAINIDRTSALFRRFATPGVPPELGQNLTVSEAVNGLTRSGLIGKVVGTSVAPGPLSGPTDEDTTKRSLKVLNIYFDKLRSADPSRWEAGKAAYIAVNPGIRAHLMLVTEIVNYLRHKKQVDFDTLTEEKFADYILEIASPVFAFVRDSSDDIIREKFSRMFGEGGVRVYLFNLYEIIHQKFEDFGSEEFLKWMRERESSRQEEANSLVLQISELMTNCVIDTLKRVHGTHRLPSGEPAFWEIGVESRRVKDNAHRKQQDDQKERRRSKEAYLDIVDLLEIIKQQNNWPHFEHIFNLPTLDEKKGKRYYLAWMNNFNELRQIAAHKNRLRTYSDEDLEFLDWLRSELLPRLTADKALALEHA